MMSVQQDGHSSFWEADFLVVEKSGFAREYEIKLSRADFKNDLKKTSKHDLLKSPIAGCPNRFYYACPTLLIKPEEVPYYAGLVYVEGNEVTVIKKAPRLHSLFFPNTVIASCYVSLMYRYWKLKTRGL